MPATLAGVGILVDYLPVHLIFVIGSVLIFIVAMLWFGVNRFNKALDQVENVKVP